MLIESPVQRFMNGSQGSFVSKCVLATIIHSALELGVQVEETVGPTVGQAGYRLLSLGNPKPNTTWNGTLVHAKHNSPSKECKR